MKAKLIIDKTISRSDYNRAYKRYLKHTGKIKCSYCKYHDGENSSHNFYGGWFDDDEIVNNGNNIIKVGKNKVKFPNWKLITKNRKQWMEGDKVYKFKRYRNNNLVTISW